MDFPVTGIVNSEWSKVKRVIPDVEMTSSKQFQGEIYLWLAGVCPGGPVETCVLFYVGAVKTTLV